MLKVKKRYIVDEDNRPIEVVLDIATFARIEAALEDHLFGKILQKTARKKSLSLSEAKARYARMKKRS